MDIPLKSKAKRGPKKLPYREDLPIEIEPCNNEFLSKRKTTQTQNPKEQPASKN